MMYYSYPKELVLDLWHFVTVTIPFYVRDEVRYRSHRLADLLWNRRLMALIEVIDNGRSYGMMRTPAYRWKWLAYLVSYSVTFRMRKPLRTFAVTVLDEYSAYAVEARYSKWLDRLNALDQK